MQSLCLLVSWGLGMWGCVGAHYGVGFFAQFSSFSVPVGSPGPVLDLRVVRIIMFVDMLRL